jgi:hypothetical protein
MIALSPADCGGRAAQPAREGVRKGFFNPPETLAFDVGLNAVTPDILDGSASGQGMRSDAV